MNKEISPEELVFGLDIGTRSIVGSVGYKENDSFNVVAFSTKEHETRSMLDGQIHDLAKVSETIKYVKEDLEKQIGHELKNVCIAAAGRVLKTLTVRVDMEREEEKPIVEDEIYSLDMLGVEKAYEVIRENHPNSKFYCVGYSAVKYYINNYSMSNLIGHKASSIGVDILGTFLPNEVIDDLYTATGLAGLNVANITLEPIAAINIAIPTNYRLLNIALIDVGAGTSDICITKEGSVVAYGMIPHAGDEITEDIAHKCLCDFETAEKIKLTSMMADDETITYTDLMGLTNTLNAVQIRELYVDKIKEITSEIADTMIRLNSGKSVAAVFVVGGGGKAYKFTEFLAENLGIAKERVALRGEEVLGKVNFLVEGVKKDPLLVTPIGISLNSYNINNQFIFVNVNDKRIKLYDNSNLNIADIAMEIGLQNDDLFPKRGADLNFTVNNVTRMIRGEIGDAAVITINGKNAIISAKVSSNDKIIIIPSTKGDDATYRVSDLAEYKKKLDFIIDEVTVSCPRNVLVNGEMVAETYNICEGDRIDVRDYYTIEQLIQYMDINMTGKVAYINGHRADKEEAIHSGFKVTIEDIDYLNEPVEDIDLIKPKEIKPAPVFVQENNNLSAKANMLNAMISTLNKANELLDLSKDIPLPDATISESPLIIEPITSSESLIATPPVAVAPVTIAPASTPSGNTTIVITVNGSPVTLTGKPSYIYVDIFDFYPFDTRKAGGIDIVTKINGQKCAFTSPLNDGDITELYWEQ